MVVKLNHKLQQSGRKEFDIRKIQNDLGRLFVPLEVLQVGEIVYDDLNRG